MPQKKAIITCAITGSIHTPTMSEHLPITPDEIAEQAIGAAEAGAAVLHLHARKPDDGRPTQDPDVYMQFLPRIKQNTNAVVNITTGGGLGMPVEERLAPSLVAEPELCSLNMGSMNFGIFPMLEKYEAWKYGWEPDYLASTKDFIFKNTFNDIESILTRMGKKETRFEFECYDAGHLYTLKHFYDRGLVKAPIFVQFVMGILGGIGADTENLVFLKKTADKLFGEAYVWSILGAGRMQMPLAAVAAGMGGNVRVGLEDSLLISRGKLAKNNAEQVAKVRSILESLSIEVATPDEAREILALKGGDRVKF